MEKRMTESDQNVVTYCGCGCVRGFVVNFKFAADEDEIFFSSTTSSFEAHQTGFFGRLKRRIRAAWFMLTGKEYLLHEVILTKAEFSRFLRALNRSYRKVSSHGYYMPDDDKLES